MKPKHILRFALVLTMLIPAAFAQTQQRTTAQQASRAHQVGQHLLLIMPFENESNVPGLDWIGEAFPEVLGERLAPYAFVVSRQDRLYAFDRLGIPSNLRPSRVTLYRIAEEMDVDFVILGRYSYDGKAFVARAQLLDMKNLKMLAEQTQVGPLQAILDLQTALAWDLLRQFVPQLTTTRQDFLAYSQPVRLDALENYVRGMVALKRQDQVRFFRQALKITPGYTQAQLQLGRNYMAAREYGPALEVLGGVSPDSPAATEANFLLGLAAFYTGDLERSERAFQFVSARLPLTEVVNNQGVVAARRGKKQALEFFSKAVEQDPRDPEYRFNYGLSLYKNGNSAEAKKQFDEALRIRPNDSEAKLMLDVISGKTTLPAAPAPAPAPAASAPKPANGVLPQTTQAQTPAQPRLPLERIKRNYDETSYRQLQFEIEQMRLQQSASMDPGKFATQAVERGHILFQEGATAQAEREFRDAIQRDPTNTQAHVGLGRVLLSKNDTQGARAEAQTALKLRPSADAHLLLAEVSMEEDDLDSATVSLDQAQRLDPNNSEARKLRQQVESRKR